MTASTPTQHLTALPVRVINLESSRERREVIEAKLLALGIQYEIVRAVNGRTGEHLRFSNYRDQYCLGSWRRTLTPGEVGCFASHYLLWQKCVETGEPIIVMEDDVELENSLADAISLLPALLLQHGFIRLSGISKSGFRSLPTTRLPPGWEVVRFYRGPMGTQCYALSPSAAVMLLRHAERWVLPVDNYIDEFWSHGVESIGLMPFVAYQSSIPSDIRQIGGKQATIWRPKRVIVRLTSEARRIACNFLYDVCSAFRRVRRKFVREFE